MRKKVLMIGMVLVLAASMMWAAGVPESGTEPKKLEKVDFLLNWTIAGDHSPYYVAQKFGWFAEEGLDVNIIVGQGSGYSVQAVDSGKADIAISDAPVPITSREKGANVKIIGIIFDKHPNCSYFWKDSGIKVPQDLTGKTVAVPATDGHKVMWPAFAKQIGVDPNSVKFVNIDPAAKVSALASRKADVVFELFTGKPFMEKAIPADQLGYFVWADYGFNAYAHSYIASDKTIKERPELLKKFLKVAYRAWEYTLNNPEEAIEILSEYHPINKVDYLGNLKVCMEFFKTDRYKNYGIGYIDPQRIRETYSLVDQYQQKLSFPVEDCFDASFLPSPMYKYNF
ncbi:MAG: putative thiamine biosynthesis protein [Spirochaetes bacterium ADurb.Bin315]|nr:MAG: putative thiamine biosynthesis protein [Spirochaetes bacterium ADurb.Bin315]HOE89909.1 ABC transporter substrate-binding protein [Sphaerochaeta sp.]